ncbi:DUF1295 domain-containing protein [Oxynema sp. CENA135]|nr:DUF1295 domain-containing protein [Oxynema sp. CENA135]
MQDSAVQSSRMTELTAINLAKTLTLVLLIACALIFRIQDWRQVLYLCLHGGYCVWWLLEQWLYPERRKAIFSEPISAIGVILCLLIVGVFYAMPGYFAFTNPEPLAYLTGAIALILYTFGSLINTSADVQKLTAKQYGAGLVTDGVWRFSRHINYFADLLRYLSFSVLAGSPWAYGLTVFIAALYLSLMSKTEKSRLEKYPEYPQYAQSSKKLIPGIW